MARKVPEYDIIYKNRGDNIGRLKAQGRGDRAFVYFSNHHSMKHTLLSDHGIDLALRNYALQLAALWKRRIPRGENSSDGHVRDAVKTRKIKPGGVFKDRQVYEVYNDAPGYSAIEWANSSLNPKASSERRSKGKPWSRKALDDMDRL